MQSSGKPSADRPAGGRRWLTGTQWQVGLVLLIVSVCATVALLFLWSKSAQSTAVVLLVHPLGGRSAAQVYRTCASSGSGVGKRYLVTGAAGFIGFSVAQKLRERGDVVVGVDNFNDYYPVSLKRARASVLRDMGVTVVELDLNDLQGLQELFRLCSFTHVLHLAAQAGVRYAARNPFAYVQSNIAASVSLMETMRMQKPMPLLIYASSSSVYGLSKQFPFTENDRADRPASLYAATKRSQELLAHTYFNIYRMSVTGLRFFTVYGPWGRPDMSVMSFSRNIVNGKPIRVFKGPNGTELARDFTYIGDIVSGVIGALDTAPPSADPRVPPSFRLYNLGNTQVHTVTEMVETLQELLGLSAVINYQPLPPTGDVLRTNANITAAREALGYAPKTNLREGLKQFVLWYFDYYGEDGKKIPADEVGYIPD
ncbi:UDP-glucuronate 4-epimerase 2 [Tetrabaena socialis]|uniref:UDP-glucuronate 4-epimerase 2 n=1 Tax=Tetrabaena socialis TaxID=47790 RepID=A0A2J8AB77_9CHLO|nr:UDP-glucuronate 4-epimerase 2 [Tetrabaena socialis]|eukprot:PNH09780.1 UDP-glucuronate 4-epimerase 2 [Tetrabaena socialis]